MRSARNVTNAASITTLTFAQFSLYNINTHTHTGISKSPRPMGRQVRYLYVYVVCIYRWLYRDVVHVLVFLSWYVCLSVCPSVSVSNTIAPNHYTNLTLLNRPINQWCIRWPPIPPLPCHYEFRWAGQADEDKGGGVGVRYIRIYMLGWGNGCLVWPFFWGVELLIYSFFAGGRQ